MSWLKGMQADCTPTLRTQMHEQNKISLDWSVAQELSASLLTYLDADIDPLYNLVRDLVKNA